ncbi:unnamed protein product [Arabidopsis thaliana]|uniref:(thale cress) hypothetical protein n=1 Tax=Arabidopsis thaliana TaxID=3702 RepID=A0A7G2EBI2_ARATH|nr:unnamed protein product [Arabidopsis thaliana]
MASKALILLGLFSVLLVVSEVSAARQSGMVKPESEETVQPEGYGGGHGGQGGHDHGGHNGGGGHRQTRSIRAIEAIDLGLNI